MTVMRGQLKSFSRFSLVAGAAFFTFAGGIPVHVSFAQEISDMPPPPSTSLDSASSLEEELGLGSPPAPEASEATSEDAAAEPSAAEMSEAGVPEVEASDPGIPDAPEADELSGFEVADELPVRDQGGTPPPPKTEQGFQQMLDRKGRGQQPTEESVKQAIQGDEGRPFRPDKMRSLFFTYWQHEALLDAKRSRGNVRPPTQSELNALGTDDKIKPANRDLRLGGIVYVNAQDWTIWLNDMRVTPSAIPPEVIDLRVYKEYVEVKWLDDYTNQIFPIRIRPNSRFNLDARIFLTGE